MPCWATTEDGIGPEDPLNFVLIGSIDDVMANFVIIWQVAEVLRGRSAHRRHGRVPGGVRSASFWSYVFGGAYRHAPISLVYLFGQRQDPSQQKARETARERNHLSLWATPLRYDGAPVWIGQISATTGCRSAGRISWATRSTRRGRRAE